MRNSQCKAECLSPGKKVVAAVSPSIQGWKPGVLISRSSRRSGTKLQEREWAAFPLPDCSLRVPTDGRVPARSEGSSSCSVHLLTCSVLWKYHHRVTLHWSLPAHQESLHAGKLIAKINHQSHKQHQPSCWVTWLKFENCSVTLDL
jgi:hypothetical protein